MAPLSDLPARLAALQRHKASDFTPDADFDVYIADEVAAALVGAAEPPRMFPIQNGPAIPWEVIAPFDHQCQRNHRQTVERLAQRGGLGIEEALPILLAQDYQTFWKARGGYEPTKHGEYINELLALVRQRQQATGVGAKPPADKDTK